MAERLPYPVFDSPLTTPPLTEAPRLLRNRPNHRTVVDVYNRSLTLLIERRSDLEHRRLNGEFNTLGLIAEKIETGGSPTSAEVALMRDFRTLVDASDAEYGRRNLNIARHIEAFSDTETRGIALDPQQEEMRLNYQAGDFHLVLSEDHPLNRYSTIDRFIVPISEGDKNYAFIDGAPVDGIIRELDRRIAEHKDRRDISWLERRLGLRSLRHDRDVLYTSSTTLIRNDNVVTHARKQYEALLKSENPVLSEWEKPDWYKSELMLRDRRVLNLQRGRNRWGCVPLLLPIPLIIALPFIWPRTPESAPVVAPAPVIVSGNPCYDVPGGQLRVEVFDLTKDPNPSFRGANQREMAYQKNRRSQREFKPSDDEQLIEEVRLIEDAEPDYAEAYLGIAVQDEVQTAQRIRGDQDENPWIAGTDFSTDQMTLVSCLSPQQRDEKARDVISQNR